MGHLLQDLRYALRTFRKSPLFVTVALGAMGILIGLPAALA